MTQTLEYLNGVASTVVNFTDTRPSGVIFDRVRGKEYDFTETSTSFPLLVGGNILEIINSQVAQVRFRIELGNLQATIVPAPGIPNRLLPSQEGNLVTFSNIQSVSDWEFVKQTTIVLSPDAQGNFNYIATILYNSDTENNLRFQWTVGLYIPVSLMQATTSSSVTAKYIRGGIINLSSKFTQFIDGTEIVMPVEAQLDIDYIRRRDNSANLLSGSSLSITPKTYNFTVGPVEIANSDSSKFTVNDQHIIYERITTGQTGTVTVADNLTGETLQTFSTFGTILAPGLNATNNLFATSQVLVNTNNYRIRLYQRSTLFNTYSLTEDLALTAGGSVLFRPSSLTDNYLAVTDNGPFVNTGVGGFNPTNYVYSISTTGTLTLLYNIQSQNKLNQFNQLQTQNLRTVAISDQYIVLQEFVSGAINNGNIFVHNITNGSLLRTITLNNSSYQSALINGNKLYFKGTNNNIRVWNLDNGALDTIEPSGDAIVNYEHPRYGVKRSNEMVIVNFTNGKTETTIPIPHRNPSNDTGLFATEKIHVTNFDTGLRIYLNDRIIRSRMVSSMTITPN
jgi:hypothetical protein